MCAKDVMEKFIDMYLIYKFKPIPACRRLLHTFSHKFRAVGAEMTVMVVKYHSVPSSDISPQPSSAHGYNPSCILLLISYD